ncbi:hypothetical protein ABZ307_07580 [Streptomyces griseorubiginosus]
MSVTDDEQLAGPLCSALHDQFGLLTGGTADVPGAGAWPPPE